MTLEPEADDLLSLLVEASRSVPRARRGGFMLIKAWTGAIIKHEGLPGGILNLDDEIAFHELEEAGLFRVTMNTGGRTLEFDLRASAFEEYDRPRSASASPLAVQEELIVRHLISPAFGQRFPEAAEKWASAQGLLWQNDSDANLTTIGHQCREALQLFATAMLRVHGVPAPDPDVAKTVRRLRSVIAIRKGSVSHARLELLEALLVYWGALSDMVQRQEHGGQKDGEVLGWDDGRLVVLYTALVMQEFDRLLG